MSKYFIHKAVSTMYKNDSFKNDVGRWRILKEKSLKMELRKTHSRNLEIQDPFKEFY